MFSTLFKKIGRLFGSPKKSTATVHSKTTQAGKTEAHAKTKTSTAPEQAPPEALNPAELADSDSLFYDLMLGAGSPKGDSAALEQQILTELEQALNDIDSITDNVVQLPALIQEIDKELSNPEHEAAKIASLIEQDPVIAAKVLKLANAPAYKPPGAEIHNLQQAITFLGGKLIHQLVIVAAMQQMADTPKIYFKLFGQQIWSHSLQTALITKKLATTAGVDNFTAYLTGLVHDIGKIAIFKILVDALRQAHPDLTPGSSLFRQALTRNSLELSYKIAENWHLPEAICQALKDQLSEDALQLESPLSKLLYQANAYSEINMLMKNKLIDETFAQRICVSKHIDPRHLLPVTN
jgi:HD-like signal output (HDOD) protein